jgi:hypothetical protein
MGSGQWVFGASAGAVPDDSISSQFDNTLGEYVEEILKMDYERTLRDYARKLKNSWSRRASAS